MRIAVGLLALAGCAAGELDRRPGTSWVDRRREGVVMQEHDFSCGAAALLTLLEVHFGMKVDELNLVGDMLAHLSEAQIQIKRTRGFSLLDLKRAAERRGLRAIGVRLPLEQLLRLRSPALLHLRLSGGQHFAMWEGVREGRAVLADPQRGRVRITAAQLSREWTGAALILFRSGEPLPLLTDPPVERSGRRADQVTAWTTRLR